jgi:hypothetical protein
MARAFLLSTALLLAGCFSPSYSECPFACARSSSCPAGYSCDPSRALCCRGGSPPADRAGRELALDLRSPDGASDGPRPEAAPVRELARCWDSDAEWATGQHARTKTTGGVLGLTMPASSVKRGPQTVVEVDAGKDWYHWDAAKNWIHDPSVLASGTAVFCDLTPPAQGGDVSRYLHLTSFGLGLPAGALVDGIVLELARYASGTTLPEKIKDESVRLVVKGARGGQEKKNLSFWTQYPPTTVSYGGSGDCWGLALDAPTVNAADFGCALRVRNYYTGSTVSAWVTSAPQLTVHFTDASGEWLSPLVALDAGAKCWDSLETKQEAPATCGAGAVVYDVLDESGNALLANLGPAAVVDLSGVGATKLRVRARLRTASKSCLPGVDYIKLYWRR